MVDNEDTFFQLFKETMLRYAPIADTTFAKLKTLARFREIDKGEVVLQVHQTAKKMHFVCRGIVCSQYLNPDGSSHIKNFFLQGNFASSTVSLLQGQPSEFSLQVLETGVLMDLDFQQYQQLIHSNDDLKSFYIAYLEKNWVIANEKRQIAFATQSASERYRTFLQEYPGLEQRVPQLHIASYLGITPTQLSRIRKERQ